MKRRITSRRARRPIVIRLNSKQLAYQAPSLEIVCLATAGLGNALQCAGAQWVRKGVGRIARGAQDREGTAQRAIA
eukprot:9490562-Pyramimonas_sp.AAC.1